MTRMGLAALAAVTLAGAGTADARLRIVAREGNLVLRAESAKGQLCLRLKRPGRAASARCGRVPLSPFRRLQVRPFRPGAFAAAVAPAVRFAEAQTRGGRRVRYRARSGRGLDARFVLIPARPEVRLIRLLAADGETLSVVGGPGGYIGFGNNEVDVVEGVTASTQPAIAPLPDDPGRIATRACVDLVYGSGGSGFCDSDGLSGLVVQSGCEEPDLVGGVVQAGAVAVRLTLGSGAEVIVPGTEPPAAYAGRAPFGKLLPAGEAIREAAAIDASGEVIDRALVGAPPSGQPCAGSDQAFDGGVVELEPAAPPIGQPVAAAGGHRLVVADRGETLCAGLGTLPTDDCPAPAVDSVQPRLLRRGRTVAAVLSANAARVTLRFDRGPSRTVRTVGGRPYTGRWAGRLRFFATTLPDGLKVVGSIVRTGRGEIIGLGTRGARDLATGRRVVVESDGFGLELDRRGTAEPCLSPFATITPPSTVLCTDLTPPTPIDGPTLPYTASVTVACDPRRAMAWGRFPDGLSPPVVQLAGGKTVRTRRVRLRGEDAFVAFLPDQAVTGFRAGKRTVALALPPTGQQCGYSVTRYL